MYKANVSDICISIFVCGNHINNWFSKKNEEEHHGSDQKSAKGQRCRSVESVSLDPSQEFHEIFVVSLVSLVIKFLEFGNKCSPFVSFKQLKNSLFEIVVKFVEGFFKGRGL